jgi:hypothetical protein
VVIAAVAVADIVHTGNKIGSKTFKFGAAFKSIF